MAPQRNAAAIYARISQDREGTGLGIERQLQDCRAEAIRLGWTVAEEYIDDDASAYSGKRRPSYERMLDDIATGYRDAILVWHIDRLHRRPIELEELARTCATAGVTDLRTVHGAFDLGTGDGMLVARLLAAVAANESDAKRRRGRRKTLELAQSGKPHAGGCRPFGFLPDRITHDPHEAEVIRTLASRALAGESMNSLARWLMENGVTTVTGIPWRSQVVRSLLLNPRIYGVRVHQGQPIGPGMWDPIISAQQGEQLRILLTDPARRTNRTARRYLLSGMCTCHLCGTTMYSVPRYETRRYLCRSGHDFGGCGRMAIAAEPLELIIAEAVLQRLDSPALHDALAGRTRDDALAGTLRAEIAQDTEQLEELSGLYVDKKITAHEWVMARDGIEARRTQARNRLATLTGTQQIDQYVGNGEQLRHQWSTLNLSRQRAIVQALIDHVEIMPGRIGSRQVEVERIRPVWRV